MTSQELNGIWYYFLSLEEDLANTSRYIEPAGQENVHSYEFAKLLILSCIEIESVFKAICCEITGRQPEGNIGKYKEIILGKYPKIIEATVFVGRWGIDIKPLQEWSSGPLTWWGAYQEVKHSRGLHFDQATYKNAVYALAALYISIFYLSKCVGIEFQDHISNYISSDYSHTTVVFGPTKRLPDFEEISP